MHVKSLVATLGVATLAAAAHSAPAHALTKTANTEKTTHASQTVVVKPGDTLSGIATAHKTTYVRVFDANSKIKDPDLIYPNQKVRIPSADEKLPDRPLPTNVQQPVVTPKQADTPAPAAAPAATPAPAPAPAPVHKQVAAAVAPRGNTGIWDRLAQCESGGNWSINTGNGFYGGLQFTLSSWQAVGGTGLPSNASREEQIARAQMLQARQGWGAWPVCSHIVGLR